MFKAEYLWNGWVKKDGFNANLVLCDWLTWDTLLEFAFGPRLMQVSDAIKEEPNSARIWYDSMSKSVDH